MRGKRTKGSDCTCSHQKSTYTPEWKKKLEEGPKRPKNDGICSFWKKATCKKGKDCKFKHPKNSAPAEKGSDTESEAGSEKKKKKKKAKAAPVISLWEDSESEAEPTCSEEDIVDSDAETECAPATPKAKLYFPKKGRTVGKLTESALGILDYPESHAEDLSGGLFSSPDKTPIAAPAEEPGEEEEGDADERDEGGGSDEDEVEVDVEAGRGVKRKGSQT